jgi:hypothetical protein
MTPLSFKKEPVWVVTLAKSTNKTNFGKSFQYFTDSFPIPLVPTNRKGSRCRCSSYVVIEISTSLTNA